MTRLSTIALLFLPLLACSSAPEPLGELSGPQLAMGPDGPWIAFGDGGFIRAGRIGGDYPVISEEARGFYATMVRHGDDMAIAWTSTADPTYHDNGQVEYRGWLARVGAGGEVSEPVEVPDHDRLVTHGDQLLSSWRDFDGTHWSPLDAAGQPVEPVTTVPPSPVGYLIAHVITAGGGSVLAVTDHYDEGRLDLAMYDAQLQATGVEQTLAFTFEAWPVSDGQGFAMLGLRTDTASYVQCQGFALDGQPRAAQDLELPIDRIHAFVPRAGGGYAMLWEGDSATVPTSLYVTRFASDCQWLGDGPDLAPALGIDEYDDGGALAFDFRLLDTGDELLLVWEESDYEGAGRRYTLQTARLDGDGALIEGTRGSLLE